MKLCFASDNTYLFLGKYFFRKWTRANSLFTNTNLELLESRTMAAGNQKPSLNAEQNSGLSSSGTDNAGEFHIARVIWGTWRAPDFEDIAPP